jgi:hypothetical protein
VSESVNSGCGFPGQLGAVISEPLMIELKRFNAPNSKSRRVDSGGNTNDDDRFADHLYKEGGLRPPS